VCDIDLQELTEVQKTRHVESHFQGKAMDSVAIICYTEG